MAVFPYTPSVKSISDAVAAFRKAMPSKIDSETLKKLQIAPNNESNLISILTFIKIIDVEGKNIKGNTDIFFAADAEFKEGLSKLIQNAYNDLFSLFGPDSWNQSADKLVGLSPRLAIRCLRRGRSRIYHA